MIEQNDGIEIPFGLTKYDGNYHQTQGPIMPDMLLSRSSLEKIIEETLLKEKSDQVDIRGILGERLAIKILEKEFEKITRVNSSLIIKQIGENSHYLLNSSRKYILKNSGGNRYVILRKDNIRDKKTRSKFGFTNVAEFDGFFMFKTSLGKRTQRRFLALETKTGEIKLSSNHVLEDIILPLEKMYECPIHYMLIGFKENMYSNKKTNKLNKTVRKFYEGFPTKYRDRIHVSHFPFQRISLEAPISEIEDTLKNRVRGRASLDIASKKITIVTPLGRIYRGTFTKEED